MDKFVVKTPKSKEESTKRNSQRSENLQKETLEIALNPQSDKQSSSEEGITPTP